MYERSHTCAARGDAATTWLSRLVLFLIVAFPVAQAIRTEPASQDQLVQERSQSSTPFLGTSFVRMMFHASVVVGNTLYMDGGEVDFNISSDVNSSRVNGNVPMNNTLSIDLSQSWTPATVAIDAATKPPGAPILNGASLWPAADNQSFYSFGGGPSGATLGHVPEALVDLWQFKDKSWSRVQSQSGSSPSLTQVRPGGGFSASGGGAGYMFGGFRDNDLDGRYDLAPLANLLTYNMTTNSWTNDSTPTIAPYGTTVLGQAHFVDAFGAEGVLLALGGEHAGPTTTTWIEQGQNFNSFSNLTIYDPSSKTWHWQTATGATGPGDIPPNGVLFCATGARSAEGTYEIFVYGGHSDTILHSLPPGPSMADKQNQAVFNAVYVLSLPGFVWFRSKDTSAEPRTGHSCEAVGNRQMLSIGGLNPTLDLSTALGDTDPWPQGLGVFDMVEMRWTNAYDANAQPYVQPDAVREWYSQPSAKASTQWSSPETRALFDPSAPRSTPQSSNPSPPPPPSTSSSSTTLSTGAIVGIALGSFAGASLLTVAAWYFLFFRRRRRLQRKGPMEVPPPADDIGFFPWKERLSYSAQQAYPREKMIEGRVEMDPEGLKGELAGEREPGELWAGPPTRGRA